MISNSKSLVILLFTTALLTGFISIACTQSAHALSIDLSGLPGIAGNPAFDLLKGPKGDTGPQGPAGPKGDKGDKGDTGPQGPAGPKGDKGDKGDTGAIGPAGPAGAPCPHTSNAFEPPQGSSADPHSNIINSDPKGLFCVP